MRVDNTNKIYKRKWHGTKLMTGGVYIYRGWGSSLEKCGVICVDLGVRGAGRSPKPQRGMPVGWGQMYMKLDK